MTSKDYLSLSFSPEDNITPEKAHEIGIKLAEKLWGEKYQVIVATHLDKAHHLHNHFIVNSVSFVDGIRYYRSESDYYNMQVESDKLCKQYSLSVLPNPKGKKGKHYAEIIAERDGKPTIRSMIKTDVDKAIMQSMTESQFFKNLQNMGYEYNVQKYVYVKRKGTKYFYKLERNFGEEYSVENIRKRILKQTRLTIPLTKKQTPPTRRMQFKGNLNKIRKVTGYRALYFYYLYRLGVLPKHHEPSPKQVYFLFREDIRQMRNISKEICLLVDKRIDKKQQLDGYKSGLVSQMNLLINERKQLRNKLRRLKGEEKIVTIKTQISEISKQIGTLRQEVKLCDDIDKRSDEMQEKLKQTRADEKLIGKDVKKNESFRRRC